MAAKAVRLVAWLAGACLLAACARAPAPARTLSVQPWTLPAPAGASLPDLSKVSASQLLLAWAEPEGNGQRLQLSHWMNERWFAVLAVARAKSFGNSVDPPRVRAPNALGGHWAQWLQPLAGDDHGRARDVVLSQSRNGGATWSAPALLNTDGTATEHGFVAMWPEGDRELGVAWLDGRDPQATSVRVARFDVQGRRSAEAQLDARSCDCCGMDAAITARGPVLAYRDRSPADVRDIVVAREVEGQWQAPRAVHADQWVVHACPINGPAIASAGGQTVAVAWYTGAGATPSVRLAWSEDSAATFAPPVELARGAGLVGQVDVAFDGEAAWVLWLEERASGQSLQLAHVMRADGTVQRIEVAKLRAHGRGAGLPRIALLGKRAHIVWTDAEGDTPSLHGAIVSR